MTFDKLSFTFLSIDNIYFKVFKLLKYTKINLKTFFIFKIDGISFLKFFAFAFNSNQIKLYVLRFMRDNPAIRESTEAK